MAEGDVIDLGRNTFTLSMVEDTTKRFMNALQKVLSKEEKADSNRVVEFCSSIPLYFVILILFVCIEEVQVFSISILEKGPINSYFLVSLIRYIISWFRIIGRSGFDIFSLLAILSHTFDMEIDSLKLYAGVYFMIWIIFKNVSIMCVRHLILNAYKWYPDLFTIIPCLVLLVALIVYFYVELRNICNAIVKGEATTVEFFFGGLLLGAALISIPFVMFIIANFSTLIITALRLPIAQTISESEHKYCF